MTARIKICGLFREADIDAVNAARPDLAGFVFAPSRRQVTPAQAEALRARLAPGIVPVGVFVDAPLAEITALVRAGVIGQVQLHGSEDEAFIRAVQQSAGCPVIRAISMVHAGDAQAQAGSAADFLLLDTGRGGTGRTFDWRLIGRLERPFFLAGGLNPDNLAEAIRIVAPYGVDLSSGVETGGFKDPALILAAVQAVRRLG